MKVISTDRVVEQLINLDEITRAIYDSNRSPVAPAWDAVVESVRAFVLRQAKAAAEEVVRQVMTEDGGRDHIA